jgi:hypothetical protein
MDGLIDIIEITDDMFFEDVFSVHDSVDKFISN